MTDCAQAAGPPAGDDRSSVQAFAKAGPDLTQVGVDRRVMGESPGADACSLDSVSPQALRVDGDPAYVNAQALSASGEAVLIAGFPNYIWRSTGESPRRVGVLDSIFGLVVDPDGRVRVVAPPMPGYLGAPHTIPRPEGGWHVVFAELAESIRESLVPRVLGVWSAAFDGETWLELERLPVPEGYDVDEYTEGASLLRAGDTLALAIIADPAGQVLLFERIDGRWSWERVREPGDARQNAEPVTVQHLALVPWPSGFALLAHKNDATIDTIYESLFLYAREPEWREHKVVDGMDPFVNWQFSISPSPAADVVTWVSEDRAVAYVGSFEDARFHDFTVDTSSARDHVGSTGLTSHVTHLADGTPLWITQPLTPDRSGELRLFAATEDSAVRIATISYPHYWMLQSTAASRGEIIAAIADIGRDRPDSTITSILLRIQARCGGSPR